jgi:propionyl-CoA carboxylase alpha chain
MHVPKIVDTSDFVMSPMPGTLISFAVEEGDHVEIGQELCIVEAMKMQNIVRAPRAGTIGKIKIKKGASLQADDVIVEFAEEPVESDEAA